MLKRRFSLEKEYDRNINVLTRTGILISLLRSRRLGVMGIDGKAYPIPTRDQVKRIFLQNKELVARKVAQGFDCLELTPLAMPALVFADLLKEAIIQYAAKGQIFRTRHSRYEPLIPVRVNSEKHVWIWETLRQALDTDKLVYFPKEYSIHHRGETKSDVIHDGRICAAPGWSVGLVESFPIMAGQGRGKIMGGRKQLEIGHSPSEYLGILQNPAYQGESGRTLEDFVIKFIIRLETIGEVSHDVDDDNALWCLGQYMEIPYARVVPTGRWHRSVGRVRLDAHRTNNKLCAQRWGVSTIVRLPGRYYNSRSPSSS
jgi:hypothetical protein